LKPETNFVLLAHVRLQAFHFLPMFPSTHKPAASAKQREHAQDNLCPIHLLHSFILLFFPERFHETWTKLG
jgi:hypothetical protein